MDEYLFNPCKICLGFHLNFRNQDLAVIEQNFEKIQFDQVKTYNILEF